MAGSADSPISCTTSIMLDGHDDDDDDDGGTKVPAP